MQTQIVQIHNLDAVALLDRLDSLADELRGMKTNFQPKEPTQYLTRSDVAELLSISLPTVNEWSAKGILSAYRLANRVYFKRHEIELAMKSLTRKGGKP
jgi:excisionase family DNA binding protein